MSETLANMASRIQRRVQDTNTARFTLAEVKEAIKDAHREHYPFFFEYLEDETSFTGASALALNTTELTIPSAFLADAATNRGPGRITRIECRMHDGTTLSSNALYPSWFELTKQNIRRIEHAASPTAKIYFWDNFAQRCEIRLYGIRPFAPPVNDADVIGGSDLNGFVNWLVERTKEILFSTRQTSNANDNMGASSRSLMAQQKSQSLIAQYRLPIPGEILY